MKKKERNGNEEKLKNDDVTLGVLASFLLATACIVFSVLCFRGFHTGWLGKNARWLTLATCIFFAVYYAVSVVALIRKKETPFRLLVSGYVLLLLFLIVVYLMQRTGFFYIVQDSERFQEYLKQSGSWMPIAYILVQYLQVVLLPVPAFVTTAAGVALFGPFIATLCSFVGIVLGSFTAFFIGRKLGYKAVAWMVGKEDLEKWQKKLKGKDNFILTAMFVLPLFPDDLLCFVAGLSSMTWQYFTVMIVFARFIGIAGTCYSVGFIPIDTWWGILIWAAMILVIALGFVFLYKNMDEVNRWFNEKFLRKKKKRKKKEQYNGKDKP